MSGMQASGAARCRAVTVTVNVEVEAHDMLVAEGAGLFGRYSYGRYGAREGVWRLLDVFAAEDIKATFFVDADDAARHPHIVEAIGRGGHETSLLGSPALADVIDVDALAERLASDAAGLRAISGMPVAGWRAGAGLMNEQTLPALARAGFVYESSFQDDDEPYCFSDGAGGRLVELPTFKYLTDTTFYTVRRTNETVRKAWREEMEAIYREEGYLSLTVSSRGDFGSGRGERAKIVGDWVRSAKRLPGYRVTTCSELAAAVLAAGVEAEPFPVLEEFPQDAAGAR